MTKQNIYANLPEVVYVTSVTNAGDGLTTCPHCGATGKFIYWFICEDGKEYGAMKGCFSKFPKHEFASEHARIIAKREDYTRKGWNLPSWDVAILDAIEGVVQKRLTVKEARATIYHEKTRASNYRSSR